MPPRDLDLESMLLSLGAIAIAIALSLWGQLGLTQSLIIATLRSIVQLTIVGYLLDAIFDLHHPAAAVGFLLAAIAIAAVEAKNRLGTKLKFATPILGISLFLGSSSILAYITTGVVRAEPWFAPQYLIPMAGMILGNAMNGAAIAAERLASAIHNGKREIETHLCLGASPARAIAAYQREAVRAAAIPSINGMMVAGLVTLPGMMTGQILSGVTPLLAVRYQLVILFGITAANLLTAAIATQLLGRQFFTANQQLIYSAWR